MFIQSEITRQLLGRLQYMKVNPNRVLAWQAGNAVEPLQAQYSEAQVETDASGEAVDLIVAMQPVAESPEAVAQAWRHVCKPEGCLIFASFGPATLNGLADQSFVEMHTWGDALFKAGWQDPVTDRQLLTLQYDDSDTLQQDFAPFFPTDAIQISEATDITLELIIGHAWGSDKSITTSSDEVVVPITSSSLRGKS